MCRRPRTPIAGVDVERRLSRLHGAWLAGCKLAVLYALLQPDSPARFAESSTTRPDRFLTISNVIEWILEFEIDYL